MPEKGSWLWRVPADTTGDIDGLAQVLGIERSKLMHLIVAQGLTALRGSNKSRGVKAPPSFTSLPQTVREPENPEIPADYAPKALNSVSDSIESDSETREDPEFDALCEAFGYEIPRSRSK
jgi:hypothetical protein